MTVSDFQVVPGRISAAVHLAFRAGIAKGVVPQWNEQVGSSDEGIVFAVASFAASSIVAVIGVVSAFFPVVVSDLGKIFRA